MHWFGSSNAHPNTPCSASRLCGGRRSTDGWFSLRAALGRRAFLKSAPAPPDSDTESIITNIKVEFSNCPPRAAKNIQIFQLCFSRLRMAPVRGATSPKISRIVPPNRCLRRRGAGCQTCCRQAELRLAGCQTGLPWLGTVGSHVSNPTVHGKFPCPPDLLTVHEPFCLRRRSAGCQTCCWQAELRLAGCQTSLPWPGTASSHVSNPTVHGKGGIPTIFASAFGLRISPPGSLHLQNRMRTMNHPRRGIATTLSGAPEGRPICSNTHPMMISLSPQRGEGSRVRGGYTQRRPMTRSNPHTVPGKSPVPFRTLNRSLRRRSADFQICCRQAELRLAGCQACVPWPLVAGGQIFPRRIFCILHFSFFI